MKVEKITTLLIEDNPADVHLIQELLAKAQAGFEVYPVGSLWSAREFLKQQPVRVVLLDLMLPDSTGLDTVRALIDLVPEAPLVVLTGSQDDALALQALALGAEDFLIKGEFSGALLARTLRYAVERKWSRAQIAYHADLLERINDAIIASDSHLCITSWNAAAERIYGWQRSEVLGVKGRELFHTEFVGMNYETAIRSLNETGSLRGEVVQRCKDGRIIHVEMWVSAICSAQGQITGYVSVNRDITGQARAREELALSESHYRAIVEDQSELICRFLPDNKVTFANRAYCQYYGLERDQLPGSSFLDLVLPEERAVVLAQLGKITPQQPTRSYEHRVNNAAGEVRWQQRTDRGFFDANGKVIEYQSVSRDITERRQVEEELRYMATHDMLTGLANRAMFNRMLDHAIQYAHRNAQRLAVALLDLDHFKNINDTLGHHKGDEALKIVAGRLNASIRRCDSSARQGGDEFTLLLENVQDTAATLRLLQRVVVALTEPIVLEGQTFFLTASIGVTHFPDDGSDVETLIRKADIAMYRAKEHRDQVFVYES